MSASQRQRSRSQPPLVSVILPTYNVERYVAEAVRSVLDQTYPHFELIIRDDGSEDATYEELLRFDDERIVLLEERRHVGGAAARNEAMARARGRYISVLDSDDAMGPRLLEEGVRLLEARPDIGMVGCTLWQMDKSGRNLQERTPPPKDPDRIQVRSAGGYTAIHHPGLMVRAEAVRTIGGYRECIPHGFDLDFHLRLLEVVDATNLWERLYFYRSHEQQMSVARLDSQTAWARRGWEAMKRRRLSGRDELEPAHPGRGVLHLEGRSRERIARLYCLWAEGVSRGRWAEDRALARRYRALARAYAPRDPRTVLRALGLRAAYVRARWRLGGVPWRTRRFLGTVLPEPVKKPIKAVLRLLRPPADGPATAEPAADESPKAAPPGPEREQRRAEELAYWRERGRSEDVLANSWFESLFTRHFGLEPSFYAGKAVLDVGCGPRGSLEWAGMASRRVGLDPLAHRYVGLGLEGQDMSYVSAAAEAMPFCDGSFDVVSAFNSLDHVDDLGQTVRELVRVLRPGGLLLLIVDVNHEPTVCEPQVLSWDVLSSFGPRMRPVEVRHLERHTNNIYANVERPVPFDHEKGSDRRGVMVAMLEKVDDTGAEREGDR